MNLSPVEAIANVPGVADEPVIKWLYSEEAQALYEAEERYLDAAMPELLALLGSELTNEELSNHPLLLMFLRHSHRGPSRPFGERRNAT